MCSFRPYAFNPPTIPKPPPTYNQVCITPLQSHSRLVTLAGQTGLRVDHTISPDFRTQAKDAYTNIHEAVKAAGANPRDIVHVRHYIVKETGDKELDAMDVVDRGWGEAWIEFMDREAGGHRPPDTVLGVASLAKKSLLYEVEVWALVNQ